MFEFMAQRINVQLAKLKQKNPNAFMFIDEPGMAWRRDDRSGCKANRIAFFSGHTATQDRQAEHSGDRIRCFRRI